MFIDQSLQTSKRHNGSIIHHVGALRRAHLPLSGERLSTNRWLVNIASLTAPLRCSPSRSRSGGSFFHAVDQSPTPRLLYAPLPAQCPQRPEFRPAARELQAYRKDTLEPKEAIGKNKKRLCPMDDSCFPSWLA